MNDCNKTQDKYENSLSTSSEVTLSSSANPKSDFKSSTKHHILINFFQRNFMVNRGNGECVIKAFKLIKLP